jgi:hypothetical protein
MFERLLWGLGCGLLSCTFCRLALISQTYTLAFISAKRVIHSRVVSMFTSGLSTLDPLTKSLDLAGGFL